MNKENTDWIVLSKRPLLQQIRSAVLTCITIFVVIGVGWYLKSVPMQWAGFGLLTFVAIAQGINPPKHRTPQQAADFLLEKYNVTGESDAPSNKTSV